MSVYFYIKSRTKQALNSTNKLTAKSYLKASFNFFRIADLIRKKDLVVISLGQFRLTSIISITEVLNQTKLDEEQEEFVRILIESNKRLLNLVDNILDFSKIEKGTYFVENEEIEINEVCDAIIKDFQEKALEKNIQLNYTYNSDKRIKVKGNYDGLRKILFNIIGNAIKFTKAGSIELLVKNQKETSDQIEYLFSVTDTGIGIPEHKKDSVFNDFMQLDASSTRKYEGTGLGLALSKRLVHHMGGQIWVESENGKGSIFYFTLQFSKYKKHIEICSPESF